MLLVPFVDSGELETNLINEVLFVGGGELSINITCWVFPKFVAM